MQRKTFTRFPSDNRKSLLAMYCSSSMTPLNGDSSAHWTYEDPPKVKDRKLVLGERHDYTAEESEKLERSFRSSAPEPVTFVSVDHSFRYEHIRYFSARGKM